MEAETHYIDYMIFGRIMAFVGSEYGIVGHALITKLFVGADVVAILTQASGGSMLVSPMLSAHHLVPLILRLV